jgi:hypothetical protein
MSTYGVWVYSKEESKNFQLAKPKSVGSCEGIDLTPCGCHLHLSTISSRRSCRRGRSFFFLTTFPPATLQIGSLMFGFPHFFPRSAQVSGWLDDLSALQFRTSERAPSNLCLFCVLSGALQGLHKQYWNHVRSWLQKVLTMVYNTQNYCLFLLCILKTRQHNVWTTGSFCDMRWRGRDYSLGPL